MSIKIPPNKIFALYGSIVTPGSIPLQSHNYWHNGIHNAVMPVIMPFKYVCLYN